MLTVEFTDDEVHWITSPVKDVREFYRMTICSRIAIDARRTALRENTTPMNDEYFWVEAEIEYRKLEKE